MIKKLKMFYLINLVFWISSCSQSISLSEFCETRACSVKFLITNFSQNNLSARTIAPSELTETDLLNNYSFKLIGVSGRKRFEKDVVLTNTHSFFEDIDYGTWQFTLIAYNNDGNVLSGTEILTLDSVGTTVSFTLSAIGLEGNGTIDVNFTLNDSDITKIGDGLFSVGLYKYGTDVLITGSEKSWNLADGSKNFTYNMDEMSAGCYLLKASLSGGNLSSGSMVFWEDIIYIEPTRISSQQIILPQLIFLPTAPKISEVKYEESSFSDNFVVSILWNHAFNSEKYEIQIASKNSDEEIPLNDSDWENLISVKEGNFSQDEWVDINFEKELNTESSYVLRICSKNSIGSSNWVYYENILTKENL